MFLSSRVEFHLYFWLVYRAHGTWGLHGLEKRGPQPLPLPRRVHSLEASRSFGWCFGHQPLRGVHIRSELHRQQHRGKALSPLGEHGAPPRQCGAWPIVRDRVAPLDPSPRGQSIVSSAPLAAWRGCHSWSDTRLLFFPTQA